MVCFEVVARDNALVVSIMLVLTQSIMAVTCTEPQGWSEAHRVVYIRHESNSSLGGFFADFVLLLASVLVIGSMGRTWRCQIPESVTNTSSTGRRSLYQQDSSP
jgi:hypothetical protein